MSNVMLISTCFNPHLTLGIFVQFAYMARTVSSIESNIMKKGNFVFSLNLKIDFVEGIQNDATNLFKSNLSGKENSCERSESLCDREEYCAFDYESRATIACVTRRG